MSCGATDQANEHLRRVGKDLPKLLTSLTSPKLSEAENEEWLKLQQQKYRITDKGMIWINMLDDGRETRIKFLENKAFGKE